MQRTLNLIPLLAFLINSSAFAQGLKLSSSFFKPGGTLAEAQVYNGFGCSGSNISPDLIWSGAPEGTKAFAVTMYDPDAPTGSGWWHWIAFNIPADVTSLPAGAGNDEKKLPKGTIQGQTDFGKPGYGGPCPPPGDKPHRYVFKVYALKDLIPLQADASGAKVGFYANQLKLAEGVVTARYGRKKVD